MYFRSLFKGTVAGVIVTAACLAQTDPGPRGGTPGAGGPFPALSTIEKTFFANALDTFKEIDSVSGTIEEGKGLGPTFNGNSCAQCHAQPAVGGTSPSVNPQVALATLDHARNTVPSFIRVNGPVLEVRFISTNPDDVHAPLDGGVHGIYTIAGRTDAPGCNLAQPDFATQLAKNNLSFRIPTPVFGLGLVENTPDANLIANVNAIASQRAAFGIRGRFNTTGNDGTITRFGWKAQNKSLQIFASEAYNVEQGVSNEGFPNERAAVPGCVFNATPEDFTGVDAAGNPIPADNVIFANFMRLTAPPTPTTHTSSEVNGQLQFNAVGCALCHTPNLTTARSQFTGMSNFTYHPYSDFQIHQMGPQLTDGVHQGEAEPDEFRTAPLWGLGQRLFFLHDGRTSDLLQAISFHSAAGNNNCFTNQDFDQFVMPSGKAFQSFEQRFTCGSEADQVIARFNALTSVQKQDLLNFLRSL